VTLAVGTSQPGTPARIDVVVPTIGRPSLGPLVWQLERALPDGGQVVVVDDRPLTDRTSLGIEDLTSPAGARVRVVRSGGRGPAAARNVGWRATATPWVAFVDDDVDVPLGWLRALEADVLAAPEEVGALQGRIDVPAPTARAPTDWERNVAALAEAPWVTADMAVRRAALEAIGGFDERFPRAYREDTDLALRLLDAGWRIETGRRWVRHPVRPAPWWVSVRLQRGNGDDVLLERLHGPGWRRRTGSPTGTYRHHRATVAIGLVGLGTLAARRRGPAAAAGTWWLARTARFAWDRIAPGPRTPREVATMVITSAAIPPAACVHRARAALRWRRGTPPLSRSVVSLPATPGMTPACPPPEPAARP
jgi:glycosyltransferase involved in cell wall biosynthesis